MMARIRTIKPEFPHSESMGKISRDARLLFILLWTLADDSGRLRGNSRMLASLLFPYDNDAPKLIDGWLAELVSQNCVLRYQVDGTNYIQICKWLNHQKIDKPSASKIPSFDESSRILENVRESSCEDQGSRIKDQGPRKGSRTKYHLDGVDEETFEKFWNAYPKKTGKQAALTAFAKIKNPETVVEQILQALAWQVESDQWRKDGGQYIPNPATYLNQGRWQDEPVTALREINSQEMIELRNRRVVQEYNEELRARGEI